MKKVVILFLILNPSLCFAQKRISTEILNGVLHNHLYLNPDNFSIDNMSPLEIHDLPLKISSLKVRKNILEIQGIACGSTLPECTSIPELRIFFAKKDVYGILHDTLTLLYKIDSLSLIIDTSTVEYKKFYTQPFRVTINLDRGGFLYFYSDGYEINEIDVYKLRKKLKNKLYKK